MRALIDVAVIGAGPYGLSAAAHAVSAGLDVRVFGRPMRAWERHMPRGMFLKSEPAASDLADPRRVHTLDAYCRHEALPCAYGHPVPVETFTGYGRWFCERAVGDALEERDIAEVRATGDGFLLRTACEQQVRARAVVLAVGFVPFARRPPVLALLAPELCSHSCEHDRLSRFAGAEVAVVGAGQSALETAALLREAGARPTVLARAPELRWNAVPQPRRGPLRRLAAPHSGLGAGWGTWTWAEHPGLVRHLPARARHHAVRTALGPAGAWWLRERFAGRVPLHTGVRIASAEPGRGVRLTLVGADGATATMRADHVIAATGYAVDVTRIGVLEESLRRAIRTDGAMPRLSRTFETSVPGLYLTGLAAAGTFGPAMRFVYGAAFAARRLTQGLRRGGAR